MSKIKPVSAKTIRERTYKEYKFTGDWHHKYGNPEHGFNALFYGGGGSGKSTEVLKFSQYLAENFGKVAFLSCEERIGKSIQDKLVKYDIDHPKLYFYDNPTYAQAKEIAATKGYKFIIIDSVQYMEFDYKEYKDFTKTFGKRRSLILISQVNGKGSAKGGTDLLHAVDIKVHVDKGIANIRSRFITGGYKRVQLFKANNKIDLFNQPK